MTDRIRGHYRDRDGGLEFSVKLRSMNHDLKDKKPFVRKFLKDHSSQGEWQVPKSQNWKAWCEIESPVDGACGTEGRGWRGREGGEGLNGCQGQGGDRRGQRLEKGGRSSWWRRGGQSGGGGSLGREGMWVEPI